MADRNAVVPVHRRPTAAPEFGLTVVVPAYNEVARLPRTLDGLAAWASSRDFSVEILVVDDGSRDATAEVAARHGCGCGVIRLVANSGKGAAVRTGMLQGRGAVVAFTDADLPYRLEALEEAHDLIAGGTADVVYGGRDLAASSEAVSRARSRSLASVCYRRFASRLVSRDVPDTQCGLKAYSHSAAGMFLAACRPTASPSTPRRFSSPAGWGSRRRGCRWCSSTRPDRPCRFAGTRRRWFATW